MRKSPIDVGIAGVALDRFVLKKTRHYASLVECPSICRYRDCLQRQHYRCPEGTKKLKGLIVGNGRCLNMM